MYILRAGIYEHTEMIRTDFRTSSKECTFSKFLISDKQNKYGTDMAPIQDQFQTKPSPTYHHIVVSQSTHSLLKIDRHVPDKSGP